MGAILFTMADRVLLCLMMDNFNFLKEKFANNDELIFAELKPTLLSAPKLAYIKRFNSLDIYNGYAYFEPLSDYEAMLKQYSFSVENMKAKFKSKASRIDELNKIHEDDDIVFFKLDNKGSTFYVVYSINQNKIIDYLKF